MKIIARTKDKRVYILQEDNKDNGYKLDTETGVVTELANAENGTKMGMWYNPDEEDLAILPDLVEEIQYAFN